LELTPEEQVRAQGLDKDLPNTQTIKGLYQNQEQIIQELKDEKEFNKHEFAKGTEKFKEIFGELKEVRSEVSDMKSQITNSIDGLKNQMAKKEITDLTDEVKALRGEKKEKAKNTDKLIYGAVGTVLSLIIYSFPDIISFIISALSVK